jgi:hypothetical protein
MVGRRIDRSNGFLKGGTVEQSTRTTVIELGLGMILIGLFFIWGAHWYKRLPEKKKYPRGTTIWLFLELPIEIRAEEFEDSLRLAGVGAIALGASILLIAPFVSN